MLFLFNVPLSLKLPFTAQMENVMIAVSDHILMQIQTSWTTLVSSRYGNQLLTNVTHYYITMSVPTDLMRGVSWKKQLIFSS